jgi:hypothetical protein
MYRLKLISLADSQSCMGYNAETNVCQIPTDRWCMACRCWAQNVMPTGSRALIRRQMEQTHSDADDLSDADSRSCIEHKITRAHRDADS